ncbi:MAG: hypothetical protein HW388_1475 [Dehalococcoidia bacterium]|nr:hypothetical protein [Dehalococcoidia bacterium]
MPRTLAGKWSVGLAIALVALMALSLLIAAVRGWDADDISDNPLVVTLLVVIFSVTPSLAGLLSFLVGVFTIIKYKEWLVCVYLAVLYGLAALMYVVSEFLFSH